MEVTQGLPGEPQPDAGVSVTGVDALTLTAAVIGVLAALVKRYVMDVER